MENKNIPKPFLKAVESEFTKGQKKYYEAARMLMENGYISPEEYPTIKRRILDFDKQFLSAINRCKRGELHENTRS